MILLHPRRVLESLYMFSVLAHNDRVCRCPRQCARPRAMFVVLVGRTSRAVT